MLQQLWAWVSANTSWLFDGLGIAVAGALFGAYRWYDARRERHLRIKLSRERSSAAGLSRHDAPSRPLPLGDMTLVDTSKVQPPETVPLRYCSFCHKSERSVSRLIVAPGASICSDCLTQGLGIFDSQPQRATYVRSLCELSYAAHKPDLGLQERDQIQAKVHDLALLLRKRQREGPNDVLSGARLIRPIGAGSFATVWEATLLGPRSSSMPSHVAVKIFDQDKLAQGLMLWRFQRGIRAMRRFADMGPRVPRSIVKFHAVSDDLLSFSMEYLPGGDLQNLARRNLSLKSRVDIFLSVAEATAFAHSENVIHRDIKPANVLLRHDGTAALTDFDISDLTFAGTQSVTGAGVGTPQFAAPEQLVGGEVVVAHATADVFSLGKLLYFLLVQEPPPIGTTEPGAVPDYLGKVQLKKAREAIAQSISLSPENRPQSVSAMVRAAGL